MKQVFGKYIGYSVTKKTDKQNVSQWYVDR